MCLESGDNLVEGTPEYIQEREGWKVFIEKDGRYDSPIMPKLLFGEGPYSYETNTPLSSDYFPEQDGHPRPGAIPFVRRSHGRRRNPNSYLAGFHIFTKQEDAVFYRNGLVSLLLFPYNMVVRKVKYWNTTTMGLILFNGKSMETHVAKDMIIYEEDADEPR